MTKASDAAAVVAKAAEVAAETAERVAEAAASRIASAVKSAADSVSSAAQAQAAAAQTTAAVISERLNAAEKRQEQHETLDRERFLEISQIQKETKEELKDDIKEINIDLKRQTRTITLIVGGLIALSRAPDIITFVHHAASGGN
jgi:hypothetical protein